MAWASGVQHGPPSPHALVHTLPVADLLTDEPQEVREFLAVVDGRAAQRFLVWLPQGLRDEVMRRGPLHGVRNPSATLEKRMLVANGNRPLPSPAQAVLGQHNPRVVCHGLPFSPLHARGVPPSPPVWNRPATAAPHALPTNGSLTVVNGPPEATPRPCDASCEAACHPLAPDAPLAAGKRRCGAAPLPAKRRKGCSGIADAPVQRRQAAPDG
eukprot:TRINITY_DN17216_c0_g1_i1.p1 TRINITY_DN17216_c0_g1~~TRINITY_DN17216_c0_g1_i1.p1  ORF type:complete len:213 (+),score=6.64 TRINITY_DN17216_c0_g1_i1:154-792(+)